MLRVTALLGQYFTANVPKSVFAMQAEDWLEALRDQPEWAITKAVRWWKSNNNPNFHRKPLEGDIAERVRIEVGVLYVAERALKRGFDAHAQAKPKLTLTDQSVWVTP